MAVPSHLVAKCALMSSQQGYQNQLQAALQVLPHLAPVEEKGLPMDINYYIFLTSVLCRHNFFFFFASYCIVKLSTILTALFDIVFYHA